MVKRGLEADDEPWTWTRGLIANPLAGYEWGIGSDTVLTHGESVPINGTAAVDGSLKHGMFKELRAGGWAVVCNQGDKIGIHYGSLPPSRPTSLAAELWAVLMCLQLAGTHLTQITSDNATVVRGLGRGKSWCTAGDRALAHLGGESGLSWMICRWCRERI